ncbi:DUF4268 domain-containing protein [Flavobacterium sp. UMI-01]|uniref:DUF4268 domain-containing protein n=1 Tax=Flavobacterium sp. UMI-01 TaxID=1441053 RepID=UPI001C7E15FE|nr:DUF4268 domain-containing protein [Flavobacterium sp. UMI-01]GIZ09116.1 hypothetical protein FUMI01_18430 [Flavobacterium sp. UMI-01]
MYLINRENNRIEKLQNKTFSELKITERYHLQEWIANNPSSLGEDFLIIQKEFNGFNDTNERLDLLAIDKFGNLVIIENKLDDSGKDVTWQIIKYASYCSTLSKPEIIKIYQDYLGISGKAEEKISHFFDNKDIDEINLNQGNTSQRLILIAANFRKEVTSSALWLMNYKMRIQCFKVTPFSLEEKLILSVEQILPTKDAEDFTIRMALKSQEELVVQETSKNRHNVRIEFWTQFLDYSSSLSNLFSTNSPTKENWISKGLGMQGVNMTIIISGTYCASEIGFNTGNKDNNKFLFDKLFEQKEKIEEKFGQMLLWERMNDNVTSRIRFQKNEVSYFEKNDWAKMNEFLFSNATKMEKTFGEIVKKINREIKNNSIITPPL